MPKNEVKGNRNFNQKTKEKESKETKMQMPENAETKSDSPYKVSKLPSLYRFNDESLNMVVFKEEISQKLKPLLANNQ